MDGSERWRLTVQFPNREPVVLEVPTPRSLEELRAALEVESGQALLTTHKRHSHQLFVVERIAQLHDGASLQVHAPRRRVYVSVPPDTRKRAVMWYPGSTVEQIERAIAKAAGLSPGSPVELRDGDSTVVLSTSIPNDTVLEVVAVTEAPIRQAPQARPQGVPASPLVSEAPGRPPPQPAAPERSPARASGLEERKASASRLERSATGGGGGACQSPRRRGASPDAASRDAGGTRGASPQRGSQSRGSVLNSVGGSTTPSGYQSVPEENCLHVLTGHTGGIFCICSVGDIVFTGSQDNNIMIWDLGNLSFIGTLPGHRGFVKCLCASYSKKVLCSGSQDKTIRIWSLDTFSTAKALAGHTGAVNAVIILDGQDVLVSGSEDRSIRVWALDTYEPITTIDQAHMGCIFTLERFGSPAQVVSGARDRNLKVWDSSTWRATQTLHPPHYDGVTAVAVAARHGKFYSCSRDRSIKEWDASSLENTMHTPHAHGDWVQALCASPSSDVLFSGSRDSTVKVWDSDLQCRDVLQGHKGPVSALACVGDRLFSASHDRTVRVWKVDKHG